MWVSQGVFKNIDAYIFLVGREYPSAAMWGLVKQTVDV